MSHSLSPLSFLSLSPLFSLFHSPLHSDFLFSIIASGERRLFGEGSEGESESLNAPLATYSPLPSLVSCSVIGWES